ncbi:MAG: ATP-binding protein [Pseudohongiellaceae bacterium]
MNKTNPFRPGFGLMPPHLAGREAEQAVFAKAMGMLQADGIGKTIVMYGPRGMGKTVLLGWLEAQCEKKGISVTGTAPSSKLKSAEILPELLLPASWLPQEVSVSAGGWLSAKWTNPDSKKQVNFKEYLIQACQKEPRALLLDEAHTLDPDVCKDLLNISQDVAGKAPFLLVLAGTPGLEPFLRTVGATFVERAKKVGVSHLDEQAAADAIRLPLDNEGIMIEEGLLKGIVKDAQGYPYFLQLWGDALWDVAAEHKLTELSKEESKLAEPDVQKERSIFYSSRYDAMKEDKNLLAAALAVGKAFKDKDVLHDDQVREAIASSLSENLDEEARRDKARELDKELNRIDYVWRPPESSQVQPGIPSFMTYVSERFEGKL